MNTQGQVIYHPPPTVVVVQQPQRWYRGPHYLQHGLRWGGIAVSFPCIIYLGVAGAMLIFSSIFTMSMMDHFRTFGIIELIIGLVLISGSIGLACYSKKKYKSLRNAGHDPGRVIDPNPSVGGVTQPLNPPQMAVTPGFMQPPGGYPPAGYSPVGQPAGYPPPGGQLGGYPPPGGYSTPYPPPGQPSASYPPTSVPYDAPPAYGAPSASQKGPLAPPAPSQYSTSFAQAPPSSNLPGMATSTEKTNTPEYGAPPAYAPGYNT